MQCTIWKTEDEAQSATAFSVDLIRVHFSHVHSLITFQFSVIFRFFLFSFYCFWSHHLFFIFSFSFCLHSSLFSIIDRFCCHRHRSCPWIACSFDAFAVFCLNFSFVSFMFYFILSDLFWPQKWWMEIWNETIKKIP